MLLLFIFLLCSLLLCLINWFRGCVLFSWYLSSQWQWWWLQVKVLWWWWSLQWWFGKCSSSYLGRHFPTDVVLVHSRTLVVYVIQKTLMGLQVCKIFFFFTYVTKKNHLQVYKSAISIFSYIYIYIYIFIYLKITYMLTIVQYYFFSFPMWIEKITCKLCSPLKIFTIN
jgi:hypothetical protein